MTTYQPVMFPEEVWQAWVQTTDDHANRLVAHTRSALPPDAAPPGWQPRSHLELPQHASWGVGVAGVLEAERL